MPTFKTCRWEMSPPNIELWKQTGLVSMRPSRFWWSEKKFPVKHLTFLWKSLFTYLKALGWGQASNSTHIWDQPKSSPRWKPASSIFALSFCMLQIANFSVIDLQHISGALFFFVLFCFLFCFVFMAAAHRMPLDYPALVVIRAYVWSFYKPVAVK